MLPATLEYFSRQNTVKSGLHSWCRNCLRIYKLKYQRASRQTEHGKAIHHQGNKKYAASIKGKISGKRSRKKYKDTIAGHLRNTHANIKYRCDNPNHPAYHRYGGRGIRCLFTPDGFVDYVMDVLKIDPRGLDCDRVDNSGNYEPGNIQFITHKENCRKDSGRQK
jgi:hypothetical protein